MPKVLGQRGQRDEESGGGQPPGVLPLHPSIQNTTAHTQNASINTSHITVALETRKTGVNKTASAASIGWLTKAPGQPVRSQNHRQRRQQKRQMQRRFAPTGNSRRQRQIVTGQRRILRHTPHRRRRPVPIHVEAIRIPRVGMDLPGRPDEERIIHVERFGQEGAEGRHTASVSAALGCAATQARILSHKFPPASDVGASIICQTSL